VIQGNVIDVTTSTFPMEEKNALKQLLLPGGGAAAEAEGKDNWRKVS